MHGRTDAGDRIDQRSHDRRERSEIVADGTGDVLLGGRYGVGCRHGPPSFQAAKRAGWSI